MEMGLVYLETIFVIRLPIVKIIQMNSKLIIKHS